MDDWRRMEVSSSNPSSLWKQIWKLNVLPRVKVFAWRACHEALPTRKGLSKRVAGYDAVCGVCHCEDESVIHAVRECKLARAIWCESRFEHMLSWQCCSLVDWWDRGFKELDSEGMEEFITLCWAVWGARNKAVMEGLTSDPTSTVKYATTVCNELRQEGVKGSRGSSGGGAEWAVEWSKPEEGWYKVNVDAGLLGEVGSGMGAVIRDDEGGVVSCAVRQGCEKWATNVAEAKAVLFGMELCAELGMQRVVVESDCLGVIQALRREASGCSEFWLVVEDIMAFCSNFLNVVWSFVKHSGNKVAHDLAHLQPWNFGTRKWDAEFPCSVLNIAAADIMN